MDLMYVYNRLHSFGLVTGHEGFSVDWCHRSERFYSDVKAGSRGVSAEVMETVATYLEDVADAIPGITVVTTQLMNMAKELRRQAEQQNAELALLQDAPPF